MLISSTSGGNTAIQGSCLKIGHVYLAMQILIIFMTDGGLFIICSDYDDKKNTLSM
jgi:hypothetical protein